MTIKLINGVGSVLQWLAHIGLGFVSHLRLACSEVVKEANSN